MEPYMKADTMLEISDFFKNDFSSYLKEIRGDNTKAFTRNRKISPYNLLLQMFAKKGKHNFLN